MFTLPRIYLGRRLLNNGKLGHLWAAIAENDTIVGGGQLFSKNIVPTAAIGSVFLVHATEEDFSSVVTAGPNKPTYLKHLDNAETQRHLALSKADEIEAERRRMIKAAGKNTFDLMTLIELREHARAMMPDRRRALLAYVISQLS